MTSTALEGMSEAISLFHLALHRFEIPLHAVDTDRDAIDQ
jgi:hypothetical protein